MSHFDQLTPPCQCFVRQTVLQQADPPVPHVPTPSAAPARTIMGPRRLPPPGEQHEVHGMMAAETHPLHRLSCLFFFTAFLLLAFMSLRCLISALCGAPRAVKKVALIPPDKTGVQVAVVQVAEPLTIKV